jgi:tetratricopeptide (TPR) repeat protein
MARPPSNDIAHEQATDHWIRKKISQERFPLASTGNLVAVGGFKVGDRDLGLAYAEMAVRGYKQADIRAMQLLHSAEAQSGGAPGDHELHARLGFLEQVNGNKDQAASEYRQALAADANDSLAAGNLALILAERHQYEKASELWKTVFTRDPVELGAGFNLAVIQCGEGQRGAALATLDRLLLFAPDSEKAQTMSAEIRSGKENCGTR